MAGDWIIQNEAKNRNGFQEATEFTQELTRAICFPIVSDPVRHQIDLSKKKDVWKLRFEQGSLDYFGYLVK